MRCCSRSWRLIRSELSYASGWKCSGLILLIASFSRHRIIRKLFALKSSNPELASLLARQLFANAMVGAGLSDDPRTLLLTMNELLGKALEKH